MKPVEYMVQHRKEINRVCQETPSVSAAWDSLREALPDFELSFTVFQRHVPMFLAMMELLENESKERELLEAKLIEANAAQKKAIEEKAVIEKEMDSVEEEEKAEPDLSRPAPKRRTPYHDKHEQAAYQPYDKKRSPGGFRKEKNMQTDGFRNEKKRPAPHARTNKKPQSGYSRPEKKDPAPVVESHEVIMSPQNEKKALLAALKASKPHVRKGVVPMAIVLAEYNQSVSVEMKAANAAALREKLMSLIGSDIDFTWTMYMGANNLCLPWNGAVDELLAS